MKTLSIILIFVITTCVGQNSSEKTTQKILGEWSFQQFEEGERNGNVIIITKTKFVENVSFIFHEDYTLDVNYSDLKSEKYVWKLNRDLMEITAVNPENQNPKIIGVYEIKMSERTSLFFLQIKNNPHDGIMLKK